MAARLPVHRALLALAAVLALMVVTALVVITSARSTAADMDFQRIHYAAESPRQFGDLYVPADVDPALPLPLVVMIHGGGWQESSTVEGGEAMSRDLRAHGFAVWNLEYRGVGGNGQGGWPATYEDIATAIDFIPQLSEESGVTIDLSRVLVAGQSAGGNLAVWAAHRQSLPAAAPGSQPSFIPTAAVGIAGVYDLILAEQMGDQYMTQLFGGSPTEHRTAYTFASPRLTLPATVPVAVFSGANDTVVSPRQAETYYQSAYAAGDPVSITVLADAEHNSWLTTTSPQWALVRSTITELLAVD